MTHQRVITVFWCIHSLLMHIQSLDARTLWEKAGSAGAGQKQAQGRVQRWTNRQQCSM